MIKNVIITGANSGLGFESAKKIAKASEDFRLILACRNLEKAKLAREAIIKESGSSNVVCMELDTASLASVKKFVSGYVQAGYGSVYALLCNAGISGAHTGMTEDGFDIIFETNHLGHFFLTQLLLPYMEESGRIFVTSSDMHDAPGRKMKWPGTDSLAHPDSSLAGDTIRYSYSKLCNLYFVYELAQRLKESDKVLVNAFNPGLMQTNFMPLNRVSIEVVKRTMPKRFGDLGKSSDALAKLVTSDTLVRESGLYYDRGVTACLSSELSYDENNRKELWRESENYIKQWEAVEREIRF